MIQDALAKQIFKNLGSLNLKPLRTSDYYFKDTLKQFLLESIGNSIITIESSNKLRIEIKAEEFAVTLFSDFYFGCTRIKEQINNVNNLIESGSQVAWIITTAYYACYFMAVEVTKLYGVFILNFSKDELLSILTNSTSTNSSTISIEINNSFQVSIRPSNYETGV
jgi:hypothetical protein